MITTYTYLDIIDAKSQEANFFLLALALEDTVV